MKETDSKVCYLVDALCEITSIPKNAAAVMAVFFDSESAKKFAVNVPGSNVTEQKIDSVTYRKLMSELARRIVLNTNKSVPGGFVDLEVSKTIDDLQAS